MNEQDKKVYVLAVEKTKIPSLKEKIEGSGGMIARYITGKTSYVITDDNTSKFQLKKAADKNLTVVKEEDLDTVLI